MMQRPKSWYRLIFKENDAIDRRAYTFCVLEQLRMALRRRDIFVCPSQRWRDPRVQLLQGEDWKSAKSHVCRLLERSSYPLPELQLLSQQLDEAYRRTAANFASNSVVRIEIVEAKAAIV